MRLQPQSGSFCRRRCRYRRISPLSRSIVYRSNCCATCGTSQNSGISARSRRCTCYLVASVSSLHGAGCCCGVRIASCSPRARQTPRSSSRTLSPRRLCAMPRIHWQCFERHRPSRKETNAQQVASGIAWRRRSLMNCGTSSSDYARRSGETLACCSTRPRG